jgi:hypothetical protein
VVVPALSQGGNPVVCPNQLENLHRVYVVLVGPKFSRWPAGKGLMVTKAVSLPSACPLSSGIALGTGSLAGKGNWEGKALPSHPLALGACSYPPRLLMVHSS